MRNRMRPWLQKLVQILAMILILRVLVSIVANYSGYFPADFRSEFLLGRESYFFGAYQWAFYTHIVSGPIALLIGLFLVLDGPRRQFPASHRALGWLQLILILGFVSPSGLVIATHARGGWLAALSLAIQAILTAGFTLIGVQHARNRRFSLHRRAMWRSVLLLNSAILLRILGGLGVVSGLGGQGYDIVATWLSWLLPLGVFEWMGRCGRTA